MDPLVTVTDIRLKDVYLFQSINPYPGAIVCHPQNPCRGLLFDNVRVSAFMSAAGKKLSAESAGSDYDALALDAAWEAGDKDFLHNLVASAETTFSEWHYILRHAHGDATHCVPKPDFLPN